MKRSSVVTMVSLLALVGVLAWLTVGSQRVECEVCIEFGGRRSCATASADSEPEAIRNGVRTACGPIAGGVRDAFACDASTPISQVCRAP